MSVVDERDLEWSELERGEAHFRRKRLAAAAGGDRLGCSLYELPPGGKSWPFHYHAGNEEALYVLDGRGRIRIGDDERSLKPGTYVALPADESGAHRVVNDSSEPLRYLAFSTMREPDVTVYPDSEKVGVFAGSPPGSDEPRDVHGYFRLADAVDYWEGEESAEK
ncbi:MAG: cupin domain-containing protein [Salinigranum sp.]